MRSLYRSADRSIASGDEDYDLWPIWMAYATNLWCGAVFYAGAPLGLNPSRQTSFTVRLDKSDKRRLSDDAGPARMWGLLSQGNTLRQVVDTLTPEYDVEPRQLEHDLFEFLAHLAAKGLIETSR